MKRILSLVETKSEKRILQRKALWLRPVYCIHSFFMHIRSDILPLNVHCFWFQSCALFLGLCSILFSFLAFIAITRYLNDTINYFSAIYTYIQVQHIYLYVYGCAQRSGTFFLAFHCVSTTYNDDRQRDKHTEHTTEYVVAIVHTKFYCEICHCNNNEKLLWIQKWSSSRKKETFFSRTLWHLDECVKNSVST